jgi:hypothetical protein
MSISLGDTINDNLRDKKVIKDVTMSKVNNESYLGLRMAMALGSRYLVGEDCHWIGVTWMTREAWVEGVNWSRAAEVDVVNWGFNTPSQDTRSMLFRCDKQIQGSDSFVV